MTRPERITAWLLRSEYERFQKGTAEYGAVSNRKHYLNDVPLVPYSEARETAVRGLVEACRELATVPSPSFDAIRACLAAIEEAESDE